FALRRGTGDGGAGPFDDYGELQGREGAAALPSSHDGGIAALWLCGRPLLLAPDRQGVHGAGGFHGNRGRTLSRRRIKGYIATGRQKHGSKSATAKRPAKSGSLLARMTSRLRRAGHRSRYRLRKQVVEPVFGQVKEARGFRQFLLRGIEKVKAEWR